MEYYTTAEKEQILRDSYQRRLMAEQDRIRNIHCRIPGVPLQRIQEEDRRFFVEPDGVYFGEVKLENKCPEVHMEGGRTYEIDPIYLDEVQAFVQRHSRYMVIFHIRQGYSHRAGVYPARMIANEDEIWLERIERS